MPGGKVIRRGSGTGSNGGGRHQNISDNLEHDRVTGHGSNVSDIIDAAAQGNQVEPESEEQLQLQLGPDENELRRQAEEQARAQEELERQRLARQEAEAQQQAKPRQRPKRSHRLPSSAEMSEIERISELGRLIEEEASNDEIDKFIEESRAEALDNTPDSNQLETVWRENADGSRELVEIDNEGEVKNENINKPKRDIPPHPAPPASTLPANTNTQWQTGTALKDGEESGGTVTEDSYGTLPQEEVDQITNEEFARRVIDATDQGSQSSQQAADFVNNQETRQAVQSVQGQPQAQKKSRRGKSGKQEKELSEREKIEQIWKKDEKRIKNALDKLFPFLKRPTDNLYTYSDLEQEQKRDKKRSENGEQIVGYKRVETIKKKINAKRDKAVNKIINEYLSPWFHIESEYIGEDGKVWYSDPIVDSALTRVMDMYGWSKTQMRYVFRLMRIYSGLSIDRKGRMFNKKASEFTMTAEEVNRLCENICSAASQGNPLMIVNRGYKIRGTLRYPIGVLPADLARAMTSHEGSRFYGVDPEYLAKLVLNEWHNQTYPELKKNLNGDNVAQIKVLEDMVRALASVDGVDPKFYGVEDFDDFTLEEYLNEDKEFAKAMYGLVNVNEMQKEQAAAIRRANRFLKEVNYNVKEFLDENGQEHVNYQRKPGNRAGHAVASLARSASAANPVIGIGGALEKAKGNLLTKTVTNLALGIGDNGYKKPEFKINEFTKEQIMSDESVEAVSLIVSLRTTFGQQAVLGFKSSGMELTTENVIKFVNQIKYGESGPNGFERFTQKVENFTRKLMVGDHILNKADALRWMESLMATYQRQAKYLSGDTNQEKKDKRIPFGHPMAFTVNEVNGMMRSMGMKKFILDVSATDEGANAYCMMRGNMLGMETPLTASIRNWFIKHGITEAIATLHLDTFITYGVNLGQMMFPMSKTCSYLATHKIIKSNQDKISEAMENGMSYEDAHAMATDIGTSQIGANLEFMEGFKLCLLYDATQIGTNAALTAFFAAVVQALGGMVPPDEPEDLLNLSMWKIGDTEIEIGWWTNDLLLWSWPVAMATMAATSKPDEPGLFWNLLIDGCTQFVSGSSFMDIATYIPNAAQDYINWQRAIEKEDYSGITDLPSYALLELELSIASGVNKFIPAFLKPSFWLRDTMFVGTEAKDRETSKAYDLSDEWHIENKITTDVSYEDQLRRRESKNNVLYGFALDAIQAAYQMNSDSEKVSGYQWWEMPIETRADDMSMYWVEKYKVDTSNIPPDMTMEEYKASVAEKILTDIRYFEANGGIEQAIDVGYMIPSDARDILQDYLWSNVWALDNNYADRLKSGELADYVTRKIAEENYYSDRRKFTSIIYDWVKNPDIPEFSPGYEQLLTDYDVSYRYKDTKKAAPVWASLLDPNVEAVYNKKGNHPTSWLPFTTVDTRDRGYNAETISRFFDDGTSGTDVEELRNIIGETKVSGGKHEGEYLANVMFGEKEPNRLGPKGPDQTWPEYIGFTHPDEPTIGERAYVPIKQPLSESTINNNGENASGSVLGKAGQYNKDVQDYLKNPNYRGGSGTAGSISSKYHKVGGYKSPGGSYNPRIYSNPRSINTDRTATMNTQRPYSASRDYLNPGFSTKGSREAYKRQDI